MLISILLVLTANFIAIFAGLNLCPKQMNEHSIFNLKKITKVGGGYYYLSKIYIFPKFIVSFSIEFNETLLASDNFSIIIAKLPIETEKSQGKKKFYAIKFYYSKGKNFNEIF